MSDWYDPGVGGHGQKDKERGRIFRFAPPGTKYTNPKFDFSTVAGAAEALKSPNLSVRYLAWTALHEKQAAAEPALLKLWQSSNPVYRARALWLLGKINGKGQHYVDLALMDQDADIRILGLRLARQLKLDLVAAVRKVVGDPSPQVRRDAAIALRFLDSPAASTLWAELAMQHDGKDRWYLEALGIGADLHWEGRFQAWEKVSPNRWQTAAGRDIVWRSRAARTPLYLAKFIADPAVPADEVPRLFRSFDFLKGAEKEEPLLQLAFSAKLPADRARDVAVEASSRLKSFNPNKDGRHKALLDQMLAQNKGTPLFVTLVSKFEVSAEYPDLLLLARKNAETQLGVDAARALLDRNQLALIEKALNNGDAKAAMEIVTVLGTASDDKASNLLLGLALDGKRPLDLRRQAVRSAGRSLAGAKEIVGLAKAKKLPSELMEAAGSAMNQTQNKEIRALAKDVFPLPPSKNQQPLPTIAELTKLQGDGARGKAIFLTTGTCTNCHVVGGTGKDVGPPLADIGKKLNRQAMFESILYPSAAISFGYEQFTIELKTGVLLSGLIVSETATDLTLKGADAITRTIRQEDIANKQMSSISLMPADLTRNLSVQELVDVVAYMETLRDAKK